MIQRFYETLELSPGATRAEIKKAYRQLAKRYHPDIHPGVGREKFLEISEAYNFLMEMMDTGRLPKSMEGVREDSPGYREYEEARRRAWEKAKQMADEKRRLQDKTVTKVNRVFHAVAILLLLLNLVYAVDILLPSTLYRIDDVSVSVREYGSRKEYNVVLNGLPVEVDHLKNESYDFGVLHVSPIFNKWVELTLFADESSEIVHPLMIAYGSFFVFLMGLQVVLYFITLRLENPSVNKLSFYLVFFFAMAIQTALMLIYN